MDSNAFKAFVESLQKKPSDLRGQSWQSSVSSNPYGERMLSSCLVATFYNPFNDVIRHQVSGPQLDSTVDQRTQEFLSCRIDEGDVGQVDCYRPVRLASVQPVPSSFELAHPGSGKLALQLNGRGPRAILYGNFLHNV